MITVDRHQQILDHLQEKSNVRVSDLSEQLGASEATVRRDLEKLEMSGHIQRSHVRAKLSHPNPLEPPVILRKQENLSEKQRIGRTAGMSSYSVRIRLLRQKAPTLRNDEFW